jgi:uncharacterized delta-60 repeat protein
MRDHVGRGRRRRSRRASIIAIAWFAGAVAFASVALAAGGDLDPSFGTNGRSITTGAGSGTSVALQANGKIVVAGGLEDGARILHSSVARYRADGSLDTSFGTNGVVVTPFRSGPDCWDMANAVAVQADGKIVTAGVSYCARALFAMARYDPDGTLDPSFGTDGKVLTSFGPRATCTSYANAAAVQPDGKVVAAGIARCGTGGPLLNYTYAVARYELDGSLDPTFGRGGQVRTNFTPGYDNLADVALTAGGKIVVAGTSADDSIDDPDAREMGFALARYRHDGRLDPTFGGDGKVIAHLHSRLCGGSPIAHAVVLQPDGKIVVAGSEGCAPRIGALPGPYFAVARFLVNGKLDPAFGRHGRMTMHFHDGNRADTSFGVAIQANGKIVAVGWQGARQGAQYTSFALIRLKPGGRLDPGFGGDGKVTTRLGGARCSSRADEVVILPDDRILAIGEVGASPEPCGGFAMARYLAR